VLAVRRGEFGCSLLSHAARTWASSAREAFTSLRAHRATNSASTRWLEVGLPGAPVRGGAVASPTLSNGQNLATSDLSTITRPHCLPRLFCRESSWPLSHCCSSRYAKLER